LALREIDDKGNTYDVPQLPHQREFAVIWLSMTSQERDVIEEEINRRLQQLISSPDPNWGSITNTSIEGGRSNPNTGVAIGFFLYIEHQDKIANRNKECAARVRNAFPAAYDDLDDGTLSERTLAKYPNCEIPVKLSHCTSGDVFDRLACEDAAEQEFRCQGSLVFLNCFLGI